MCCPLLIREKTINSQHNFHNRNANGRKGKRSKKLLKNQKISLRVSVEEKKHNPITNLPIEWDLDVVFEPEHHVRFIP